MPVVHLLRKRDFHNSSIQNCHKHTAKHIDVLICSHSGALCAMRWFGMESDRPDAHLILVVIVALATYV